MPLRILVVEDNLEWDVIWKFIADILFEGTELIWATSVPEAEKTIATYRNENHEIDIIVADIFLSGSLTGIDLFERSNERDQNRFIIASSTSSKAAKAIFKFGKNKIRYLQKPFGIKQAVDELRLILKRNDSLTRAPEAPSYEE